MTIETVVRDAETVEREDAEVMDLRAEEHRAWLDNGGIDELAAHYGAVDSSDDFLF